MTVQELMVSSLCQSTAQVFTTMMGVEVGEPEVSVETTVPDTNDGVVSFIGIAGPWAGTGSITCSPELACKVCSLLLMTEASAVNEEVLDAMAELTNMIIGNVKTDLEQMLGALGLSVPTVVYGRNFKAKNAGHSEWSVVRFPWEGNYLTVRLAIAPREKSSHLLPHGVGQHCAPADA